VERDVESPVVTTFSHGEEKMKLAISRLWNEQTGAIVSAEVMLGATILVIGVIVGLKSVRDSVATELAVVGQAFANINQSYCYSATTGHKASSGGGHFEDKQDFCDGNNDDNCHQSKCVNVGAWASAEGQ
jgi:hypothetical protein